MTTVIKYLRPNEIKKQFNISLNQLKHYRRNGYLTDIDWMPGKNHEKKKGIPLYNPEEIKRVFRIISATKNN